ncbi:hypothetical protein SFRURICE_007170 [Spodoptera frugiperda]|nr:hypothetical protein SFRURICE_007170 [Spodoptera frugiperda]
MVSHREMWVHIAQWHCVRTAESVHIFDILTTVPRDFHLALQRLQSLHNAEMFSNDDTVPPSCYLMEALHPLISAAISNQPSYYKLL